MKFIRKHTGGPWFKVQRTNNPDTYSIGEHVQTKGNIITTHYICHVSDGISEPVADAITQIPTMINYMIERAEFLEKDIKALEHSISETEKYSSLGAKPERIEKSMAEKELSRILEIIKAAGVEVKE